MVIIISSRFILTNIYSKSSLSFVLKTDSFARDNIRVWTFLLFSKHIMFSAESKGQVDQYSDYKSLHFYSMLDKQTAQICEKENRARPSHVGKSRV